MKRFLVVALFLSMFVTGCGKENKVEEQTQVTEVVQEETQEVVKDVPFEKVNVIDYSKIGDETLLIIGDNLSNCQKYDIDIEQTYLEAMMIAKPYLDIKVKFEQKPNQENKNADLYNTEDVGTVTDNKETLQFGIISDWEFYDGKDLGKMSLLDVAEYIYDKYGLPKEAVSPYTITVKSATLQEDNGISYYKVVDKNNFIFYDYDENFSYTDGKTYDIYTEPTGLYVTENNPLTRIFLIYHEER